VNSIFKDLGDREWVHLKIHEAEEPEVRRKGENGVR
jgi:hypothetical protein